MKIFSLQRLQKLYQINTSIKVLISIRIIIQTFLVNNFLKLFPCLIVFQFFFIKKMFFFTFLLLGNILGIPVFMIVCFKISSNLKLGFCSYFVLVNVLVLIGLLYKQFSAYGFLTILKNVSSRYCFNYKASHNCLCNYVFDLFQPLFRGLTKNKISFK